MEEPKHLSSIANQCKDLLDKVLVFEETECEDYLRRNLNDLLLSSYAVLHPHLIQNTIDHAFDVLREVGGGGRKVCQRQFKRNDIVWICKSCQKDETCVQCNSCFQASNHQGHEVFFYHSHAGGCCDCGDHEAWDPQGFCPLHGNNPLTTVTLPDEIIQPAQRIVPCLYSMIVDHVRIYSPDLENYFDSRDLCRVGKP